MMIPGQMISPAPPGYPGAAAVPPGYPGAVPPVPMARPGLAVKQAPPPSTVRGQSSDDVEPRPIHLQLPPPEQLGIRLSPRPAGQADEPVLDWVAIHQRLDRLGVSCFQIDRSTPGTCRVTCLMPTGRPGQQRRIEARAATVGEAVLLVISSAEQPAPPSPGR
jgi:hypothetical protein